jgi:hypothetical protein
MSSNASTGRGVLVPAWHSAVSSPKRGRTPGMPMSKWITSVRDVVWQIQELKGEVLEEDIMVVLTKSLPDSYAPLIIQLDGMEEATRTLSYVITRLIGEERRQTGEKDRPDEPQPQALLAGRKRRDRSEITCFKCGEKGHFRSECPKEKEGGGSASGPSAEQRKPPSGTLY